MKDYIIPSFKTNGFNCPYCDAFSRQNRNRLFCDNNRGSWSAICDHCMKPSLWFSLDMSSSMSSPMSSSHKYDSHTGYMIYPDTTNIEICNNDLNKEIQKDYNEAASILQKSPRGACALLRLAIQKLMLQLGESGDKINDDIKKLVKKGLSSTIQKALDTVRVIGNEAVHPGELDLDDNIEIASSLFGLINIITYSMITQPRLIEEQYNQLPQSKLDAIEKRDGQD